MDEHCVYAKVNLKIEGEFHIAPIHLHYLLGNLTELIKAITELEKNGGNQRKISTELNVSYIPVRDEKP